MSMQTIIQRLKRLESPIVPENNVTMIYLENGIDKRKIVPINEAQSRVMDESSIKCFGALNDEVLDENNKVVTVIRSDGTTDDFFQGLIDGKASTKEWIEANIET